MTNATEIRFSHNGTDYVLELASDYDKAGRLFRHPKLGYHLNYVTGNDIAPCGAWFQTADEAISYVKANY